MDKDRLLGLGILAASLAGIVLYGYALYASPMIVLQVTAFIAVAAVLAILAWIGYTMTTTPTPTPVEGLEAEPSSAGGEPSSEPPGDDA